MASQVELQKIYFHPRTGKRLTSDKARLYARRTGRRIKPQLWLVVRTIVGDTRGLAPEQIASLKKRAGRIEYASRLTQTEPILTLRSLKERKVREVLAEHRVFHRLYEDFEVPHDLQRRGAVRITVSGTLEGRRIKEVIHLGFHRAHWKQRFGREEDAKETFKDWLVGSILTNVRRRGLRLSDPVQSAERIHGLEQQQRDLLDDLNRIPPQFKSIIAGKQEQLKWAAKAIQEQRKSRQLRGVTIRIEKLV